MKCVVRDRHLLQVLKQAKSKLHKAIINNCDDRFIQTLSEILHNVLNGNVNLDLPTKKKLKRYKSRLFKLHDHISKHKTVKRRRKAFANQTGGFWPLLLNAVLSGIAAYGGQKLAEYGESKITSK